MNTRRSNRTSYGVSLMCVATVALIAAHLLVRTGQTPGEGPAITRLSDAQMRAIAGGFQRPKGKRTAGCGCTSCGTPSPTGGREGCRGTMCPQVDSGTGNVADSVTGLSASAVGGGVSLSVRHDSDLADGTNSTLRFSMGYGWTHNYEMSLMESGLDRLWLKADGSVSFFDRKTDGAYQSMAGEFAELVKTGSNAYEITTTDGTLYVFNMPCTGGWPGVRYLLTSITDPNGRVTTLSYNGAKQLESVSDHFGNALTFEYNGAGRLSKVTDPLGRVMQFQYDANGALVTKITLPDGTQIKYLYTLLRQIARKTILGAVIERYDIKYDLTTQKVLSIKDKNGDTVWTSSAGASWVVDTAQSLQTGEMIYSPGAASFTDGRGHVWTYEYDDRGLVTKVTAPAIPNQPDALTMYEYDPATLKVSMLTDALGRQTQYEYDAHGNMTLMTDALGNVTQYSYDHPSIPNLMTMKVEPDGNVWEWEYDATGNLLKETDPLHGPGGPFTTYEYDGVGRLSEHTDRNGHVTEYTYDALSRRETMTDDPGDGDHLNLTTTYEYDAVGNLTSVTDPRGIVTEYQYDARNRQTQMTRDPGAPPDHLSLVTTYEYDSRNNRIATTNPRGISTMYEYDLRDRPVTETLDPGGLNHVTVYQYDANNNRTSVTDPNGNMTTYEYDARNRLITQVDDAGNDPGRLNITTRYEYDAVDNRVRMTREVDPGDGEHRVTETTYDALNRRTATIVDPAGLHLETTYDYAPPGGGGCGCNGTPGSSNVHKLTDAEGKVTYYYYDALDRQTRVVRKICDTDDNEGDADDAITLTMYDPAGNVLETHIESDPDPDLVTTYTYDAADRRAMQTVAPGGAGLTTTYQYDGNGNTVSTTRPNGNVMTYTYDNADRMISAADTVGPVTSVEYDPNGNVLRRFDGNGNGNPTPHTYDAADRLIVERDNLDSQTQYTYDNMTNVMQIVDRNGHLTEYTYDGAYRRTMEIRAAGDLNITTEFTYDDAGNQRRLEAHNETQRGPQVQVTEYLYDAANRRTQEIYPDDEDGRPHDREFTYDGVGNMLSRRDQNQDVTHYVYDDLHRLIERNYDIDADSPTYPPVQLPDTYAYDRASQLLSATHSYDDPEPDVILTYTYDGVGRITSLDQDGKAIAYAYTIDPTSNRREMTYPSGRVVREDYDPRDRLAAVTDQPSGVLIADRSYDLGDRLTHQAYANTTSTDWIYNANNWTTRITHSNGGGPFIDLEYGHDAVGNPSFAKHHHQLNASELYQYDAADRMVDFKRGELARDNGDIRTLTDLSGVTQRQIWTYDDRGNWLITSVQKDNTDTCEERFINRANEYTNVEPDQACPPTGGTAVPLVHDDNGNLVGDPTAGPGATGLFYEYDVENRLTRVTRQSDAAVIAEYAYDALARRIRRIVSNSGGLDGTTQSVLSPQWHVLAEYGTSGQLLRERTYGAMPDETLTLDRNLDADGSAIGPGDQRLSYHRNHLMSTFGLTDDASELVEAYRYDPYGTAMVLTGPGTDGDWFTGDEPAAEQSLLDNRALFTGRELDPETGLWHLRARQLDPTLGRFTVRDPIGTWADAANGGNGYAYTGSNPIARIDPRGTETDNAWWYPSGWWLWQVRAWQDGYHFMDFDMWIPWSCDRCNNASINTGGVTVESDLRNELDKGGFSLLVIGYTVQTWVDANATVTAISCPPGLKGSNARLTMKAEWKWRASGGFNPGFGPLTFDIGLSIGSTHIAKTKTRVFDLNCCKP